MKRAILLALSLSALASVAGSALPDEMDDGTLSVDNIQDLKLQEVQFPLMFERFR